MKFLIKSLVLTIVITLGWSACSVADIVSRDEAEQIANNWVDLIIHTAGNWGGETDARVERIDDFKMENRLLGYYCSIDPSGYVIVSLVKGLAPVKTYSGTSRLDLDADDGPTDMIRYQMNRMLNEVEAQAGSIVTISIPDVENLMEYKYGPVLARLNVPSEDFLRSLAEYPDKANYMEGDSLLTSNWHQNFPYYNYVPAGHNGCTAPHCTVGCVALAGAQIFRYWSWPPGRLWGLMPDFADSTTSSVSVDAVAELCSSIGIAVGMDYCSDNCESSVPTAYMEYVYEGSHYGDCVVPWRINYTPEYWWAGAGMIKDQVSANRPIQYRIQGHSIVLDGWREWYSGEYHPEYHMNYGWADSHNAWYALDGLHQVVDTASWRQEYMIIGIAPAQSLEGSVAGTVYREPFPYRYVDRDCHGTSADFQSGQLIQFLPGVTLSCGSGTVRFSGEPAYHSVLYTPEPNRGIKIQRGAMVMHPGCGIRFQLNRPGPNVGK